MEHVQEEAYKGTGFAEIKILLPLPAAMSKRDKSKNCLSSALIAKDHDELIGELIKEDCLNDERFAVAFVSGRFKLKQWGREKDPKRLERKRVSDEIAQKALEQINKKEYMAILNINLQRERYVTLKHEQYLVRKKKTMDYLMQKGYEVDLIKGHDK